jgi:hypothetical protein
VPVTFVFCSSSSSCPKGPGSFLLAADKFRVSHTNELLAAACVLALLAGSLAREFLDAISSLCLCENPFCEAAGEL